jgi:RNA polymerase sigma-70 factor (ECF subfamily)
MSASSARNTAKLWLVPSTRKSVPPASGSLPSSAPSVPPPAGPALDDIELLAALRGGDPSAAGALHDRVRPHVDRTIRRLLGGGDVDHEDLAQQAIIELVSSIDRYRGDCSLDSWTSTITAHAVYKHLRRRKTERRIFGTLDADTLAETRSWSRASREAMMRNVLHRVHAHLSTIEENKAWTFVLHDVCGYDLREIASITGVSVAAAQTRLVRGRREIHERIANDPELANLLESVGGES